MAAAFCSTARPRRPGAPHPLRRGGNAGVSTAAHAWARVALGDGRRAVTTSR
jgi:hypothetical protein